MDLERNVVLERFDLNIQLYSLSQVHKWVYQTLRTINSPLFNELTFSILPTMFPWDLSYPVGADSVDGWKAVDMLLNAIAERNPSFRIVFRGGASPQRRAFGKDHGAVRGFIESYLPLVSSKGLVKSEHVS